MTNTELLAKIKAEIERRIALYSSLSKNTVNPNRIDEDRQLLSFLDTLEEAEKPMNLEEEIDAMWNPRFNLGWDENSLISMNRMGFEKLARHFAQWGSEHLANSNDEVVINGHKVAYDKDKDAITMDAIPKDLEEAANEYAYRGIPDEMKPYVKPVGDEVIKNFIAGAKWQEEQDQETIELAEDHAYLAGAVNERGKMMKEAVARPADQRTELHGPLPEDNERDRPYD